MYPLSRRRPAVADLTNSSAFTLALLDDTWRWRQRIVEEMELGSSDHVTLTSSFQLEFPPQLMEPFVGGTGARFVKALLPLVTREKRPLLGFDVLGPGRAQGHLIRRASIAAISADYLGRLVASSPAGEEIAPGLPAHVLEAICVTTPTIFREFLTNHPDHDSAVAAYLSDGLGLQISTERARRWRADQHDVAVLLAAALREPPDPCSSSESLLVALPRLDPRPRTVDRVDELLRRYRDAVLAASRAGDESLLVALADYGRRFELILELEAPLEEPFTVKVSEQRPLELHGGWTRQRLGLRDASSFHFEARATDYRVEIAEFEVHDLEGRRIGIPPLEGARYTKEFLALSSSDPERPASIVVGLHLRPTSDVRFTAIFVAALACTAAVAAAVVRLDDALVDGLNLLILPTTFAAAIVLLREETSLAARLQRPWRLALGAAVGALWIIAMIRLLQ